ncbi:MAG: PPC domain-containing protein [Candidatus Eisenbacteria bacterium]
MLTTRPLAIVFLVVPLLLAAFTVPAGAGKNDPGEPDWHFDLGWLRSTSPEEEPNNTCATSQSMSCEDMADPCSVQPAGDLDWFSFYAARGALVTIGTDEVPGQPLVDTWIELYAPDCVTLVSYDDDHGPGNYSLIYTYLVPQSGIYHLKVRSHVSGGTGGYRLFVTCAPLPIGACCLADGSCVAIQQVDCVAQGGEYQGSGTGCQPNPCPQPVQACCLSDGSCLLLTGPSCAEIGGTPLAPESVCDPNPCQQPSAACCFADGTCRLLAPETCTQQDGQPLPEGSLCDPNPCPQPPQACCFLDGGCSMEVAENCATLGGSPQGPGTTCEANDCPQPARSCCFPDGSCQMLGTNECVAAGGELAGTTECDPNPCPQACCYEDALCLFLAEAGCTAGGGTPMGPGTLCDPNPCPEPVVGACCFAGQVCEPLPEPDCADQGGIYQGDETACDPNPCPPTPTEGTTWGRIKGLFR